VSGGMKGCVACILYKKRLRLSRNVEVCKPLPTATTPYSARLGACASEDATSAAAAVSTGSHKIWPRATRPAEPMRCA